MSLEFTSTEMGSSLNVQMKNVLGRAWTSPCYSDKTELLKCVRLESVLYSGRCCFRGLLPSSNKLLT